jgi:hypothetical protein
MSPGPVAIPAGPHRVLIGLLAVMLAGCGGADGESPTAPLSPNEPERAADVIGGDGYACVLVGDNSVRCTGTLQGVSRSMTDFTRISGGRQHACGLRSSGEILCWGVNAYGRLTPPPGRYRDVTAGTDHSCGLREDGSIACWGLNDVGQTDAPAGTGHRAIVASAGGQHTCALDAARAIVCWGAGHAGQSDAPDGTGYRLLAVTATGGCAVDADHRVRCWGEAIPGAPESNGFIMIAAGSRYVCGLRHGSVECWGWLEAGEVLETPGGGDFVRIGTGYTHACALRADGSLRCWGSMTVFPGILSG